MIRRNSVCLLKNGMIYWPQSDAYLVHLEQKAYGKSSSNRGNKQAVTLLMEINRQIRIAQYKNLLFICGKNQS